MRTDNFDLSELRIVIEALKRNKAPGPDKVVTELYKWLTGANVEYLLSLVNEIWQTETVPDSFLKAHIASLFKKGDIENLANYRPISVSNT